MTEPMASSNIVPTALLESFIPGFGIISDLLRTFFGIDLSQLVPFAFIFVSLGMTFNYLWSAVRNFILDWVTATVMVNDRSDLFDDVSDWMSRNVLQISSRNMMAKDNRIPPETNPAVTPDRSQTTSTGTLRMFNFAFLEKLTPPLYSPSRGNHHVWYKGRLFLLDHSQEEYMVEGLREKGECITISCFGRSVAPIQELLADCKRFAAERQEHLTMIYKAGGRHWERGTERHCRPWETVYMGQEAKQEFLDDMCEFLDPATSRFYARRGIPYRRGYLFHGPPGTGKTSLASAVSGILGMNLYVLSLADDFMSDGGLSALFSALPSRCVVLMEDIDAAGINRPEDITKTRPKGSDENAPDQPKESSDGKNSKDQKPNPKVTLSGLLNALDGVASQEGRIVIMTTNEPESLDKALIRPGRVDLQIYFDYANKDTSQQIFARMYSKDPDAKSTQAQATKMKETAEPSKLVGPAKKGLQAVLKAGLPPSPPPTPICDRPGSASSNELPAESKIVAASSKGPHLIYTLYDEDSEELREMARQFARSIPIGKFTPAEVQGFLLRRRKDPQKALAEVNEWREELLKSKELGKNVIGGVVIGDGKEEKRSRDFGEAEDFAVPPIPLEIDQDGYWTDEGDEHYAARSHGSRLPPPRRRNWSRRQSLYTDP